MTIKPYSLSPGETYVLQASVGMLSCQPDLVWGMIRLCYIHMFLLGIAVTSDSPGLLFQSVLTLPSFLTVTSLLIVTS